MNSKLSNSKIRNLSLVILVLFISGCGMWNNFTTYFNRYYNATELYDEGYEELMDSKEQLFQFKFEKTPKKAVDNFEKVIEKCSKILQYNRESSYFDDALFLTGKSLYFQENHLKAQRKFQELLGRNNEDFNLLAELWIGKTDLQLRNFDRGVAKLEEVKAKAIEIGDEEIAVDALSSQISFYIYREDFESAVEKGAELIEVSTSDELNAEVTYETGLMYNELGNNEKAVEYFSKVDDFSPTFEIEFYSKIEVARLKRELGQNDESLEILNELYDEDKYIDYLDQIELEIGMNNYDLQNYEEAIDKFTIVDTTYKTTESAGIAVFMKAKILENVIRDYDSSQVMYSKVNKTKAPQEYREEARDKEKVLKDYVKIRTELDDRLTQFLYTQDSMAFVQDLEEYEEWKYQDSVKKAELQKATSNTNNEDRNTSRRVQRNTQTGQATTKDIRKIPKYPTLSGDSLHTLCARSKFEMGNLFFAELNVTDSAKYYYDSVLKEFPDTLYTANQLFSLASFYSTIEMKDLSDSLFTIVFENFKGQEVANEAAKKLGFEVSLDEANPAADSFHVAEQYMFDSNFNAAITKLYEIAQAHPESDYAPKSLYTVGWILENDLELKDSASVVYDSLSIKYKTTKYAKDVLPRLNEYKRNKREIEAREKAIQDSIRQANMPVDSLSEGTIPELSDSTIVPSDSLNIDDKMEGDSTIVKPEQAKIDSSKVNKPKEKKELTEAEKLFQKAVEEQKKKAKKKEPEIEK